MVAHFDKETDSEDLDFSTIQFLSEELGLPMEEIKHYYLMSLEKLKAHARIKAFLPILASSEVRDFVQKMKHGVQTSDGRSETNH